MSWYGSHYSQESRAALRYMDHRHCKLCCYQARLQWDRKWLFGEFRCGRCGLIFPALKINESRWFHDVRQM